MPDSSKAICYGMTIRIRHVATGALLTSCEHNYRHERSSAQQIVGGSARLNENNIWKVKPPHHQMHITMDGQPVMEADAIRLEHVTTRKNLHSHDKPAPLTGPGQNEVTAHAGSGPGIGDIRDDWFVALTQGDAWCINQAIRLRHLRPQGRILHSHGLADQNLTAGLYEVTTVVTGDANDLFICESSDQPEHNVSLIDEPAPPQTEANQDTSIYPVADYFIKEWGNARKSPFFFIMSVILGAMITYWLFAIFILPGKDATIQQLSLRPESVPAQEQEIILLKSELASIQDQMPKKWTQLTKDQISLWVKTLSSQHIQLMIVYWGSGTNAEPLFLSLVDVGKMAHFNVIAGVGFASEPEIEIVTAKGEPSARILADLFKSINGQVKLEEGNAPIETPPLGTIDVFIGEKS
jgi:hypothetical protein